MRIVVCTTGGPFGLLSIQRLAERHDLVGLVRPAHRKPSGVRRVIRALRGSAPDGVSAFAEVAGIPEWVATNGSDQNTLHTVRGAAADLICVVSYPWVLSGEWLDTATVINVHPSLLPRHRGRQPLPWHYLRNDTKAGVTIHRAEQEVDAGAILSQTEWPLERGYDVSRLYLDASRHAADLIVPSVEALKRGVADWRPQDPAGATSAPAVRSGSSFVDWSWGVERIWHTLKGLVSRLREPIRDDRGRAVPYRSVVGYRECEADGEPGTARSLGESAWVVSCVDGEVTLTSHSDERE